MRGDPSCVLPGTSLGLVRPVICACQLLPQKGERGLQCHEKAGCDI